MSLSTHPSHCNCAREVGGGRASAGNPGKAGPLPFPALIGSAAATAAGAAYLLVPALINGFPFVFPDSEDYLVFTPHLHRSPFYGLFIFFFHLNRFIWAPILAQGVIASHLIWVLVRIHAGRASFGYFATCIAVLSLFFSLPLFVSFVMATSSRQFRFS
jgi:hypothetical protein